MENKIKWLSLLLVAQLVAVAAVGLGRSGIAGQPAAGPLLEFSAKAVDKIAITGSDSQAVTLERVEGRWQLPSLDGLPAAPSRVDSLLSNLAGLEADTPVATSDQARQRFKVAEDLFERRISLHSGGSELATLYLGTGAGRGDSHVRPEGTDTIHVAELAAYDMPLSPEEWVDKTLLQIPEKEIEAIELADLNLVRTDADVEDFGSEENKAEQASGWMVKPAPAEGEILDQGAVKKLVSLIADLRFDGLVKKTSSVENGDQKAEALSFTVIKTNGGNVHYRLRNAESGEGFLLEVSTYPQQFRLTQWQGDNLVNAAAQQALFAGRKGKESAKTAAIEDKGGEKTEAPASTDDAPTSAEKPSGRKE